MYIYGPDFNFVLDSVSVKVSTLCAQSLAHSNHRLIDIKIGRKPILQGNFVPF